MPERRFIGEPPMSGGDSDATAHAAVYVSHGFVAVIQANSGKELLCRSPREFLLLSIRRAQGVRGAARYLTRHASPGIRRGMLEQTADEAQTDIAFYEVQRAEQMAHERRLSLMKPLEDQIFGLMTNGLDVN